MQIHRCLLAQPRTPEHANCLIEKRNNDIPLAELSSMAMHKYYGNYGTLAWVLHASRRLEGVASGLHSKQAKLVTGSRVKEQLWKGPLQIMSRWPVSSRNLVVVDSMANLQ